MCGENPCERCDGMMKNVTKYHHSRTAVYVCDTCGFVEIIGPPKKGPFPQVMDELLWSGFVSLRELPKK